MAAMRINNENAKNITSTIYFQGFSALFFIHLASFNMAQIGTDFLVLHTK